MEFSILAIVMSWNDISILKIIIPILFIGQYLQIKLTFQSQ